MKTLRPDFVAEITKHKSLQAAGPGPSGSGKAPRSHALVGKKPLKTRVSSKTLRKGVTATPGSSSSPPETDDLPQSQEVEEDEDEEEEEASPGAGGAHPAADNRVSACGFSLFAEFGSCLVAGGHCWKEEPFCLLILRSR